jgi:thiol-disulfide isomerase/thioredoxin
MTRIGVAAGFAAGVVALAGLALFVSMRTAPPPPSNAARASCPADARPANLDFRLEDLEGREKDLRDYAGKVLLIDFWATWCEPCKAEIPGFIALYDKYRGMGFEIVGLLSLDEVKNVPAFLEKYPMNYQLLDANERPDVEQAYGPIEGLPTSLLIGRDGRICSTHLGFTPAETFEREIAALLAPR